MTMSTLIYPLLCGLSLAALPFQPEEEVLTMAGDLPAVAALAGDEPADALTADAAEIERVGRLSLKQPNRVLA